MDDFSKQKILAGLQSYLQTTVEEELYPHQADGLRQAAYFLETPIGGAFPNFANDDQPPSHKVGEFFEITAATGTGKTRMFGALIKAADVPTIVFTPRNLVNDQTRKEFCAELGIDEAHVSVYDSNQPERERKRLLEGSNEKPPPRIVIASTQSLPSLVKRHELDFTNPGDVHYRPLVVLDEVHTALGEETLKILNSFKNKVLIAGFTATDAGAAQRLFEGQAPIYTLPIVPAIERDLLCHGVRTGVIDTHPDGDWVANLVQSNTKEYRQEDVEKFARDLSVITGSVRFHLTHNDEQLGLLHRLPTIFSTEGVAAAREGARIYNEEAQKLGVPARAGFVSGNESRDEHDQAANRADILRRFSNGELSTVFNDAVLEMGFNDRNATVCYSLKPSKLLHVPEQQLGRVTRRQGEDYVERFGHDKVALAINVRAEGMHPYLFGEVLGNQPEVYSLKSNAKLPVILPKKNWVGTEPSHPPIDLGDIQIHLNYADMHSVIADSVKAKQGLPQKTEEWLGLREMEAKTQISMKKLSPIYGSIRSEWEKAKAEQKLLFTVDGIELNIEQVGIFKSGPQTVFCLNNSLVDQFVNPQKTIKWLNQAEMRDKTRRGLAETIIPIYDAAKLEWKNAKKDGREFFEASGIKLRVDQAGIFRTGIHTCFCLHETVASQIEIPEKTPAWLNINEMARMTGRDALTVVSPLYKIVKTEWEKARENNFETFEINGLKLQTDQAGIFMSGRPIFCLNISAVRQIAIPEKTPEWLSISDMASKIDKGRRPIAAVFHTVEDAWKMAKKNGNESFKIYDHVINTDQAGYFKSRPVTVFCLHTSLAPIVGNLSKLKLPSISSITPKSIKPDSDDLTREGRER